MNLTNSWPQRGNLLLVLMAFRTAFTGVRETWVRSFCSTHTNMCWRVALSLCFMPKASDVDKQWKDREITGGLTPVAQLRLQYIGRTYYNCITNVEFAGTTRGQFLMARGVRQGCLASGFLFAMACDPIFRWLHDFLQPAQCAYADDLAVAASSFRDSMTSLAPAIHSVDHVAGLNLNHRKCCWVHTIRQ